ncbi:murein L,D-transpeptidase [Pedobacter frigoris]|uniref:L,D-transpeptidase family protein n=1 Tax=Pedobacter frigoris TaxID=2571272 RepID=UPI002930A30F|nr:L,D-transpeptidase family protein [Pedobacter frigoris]
MKKSSHLLLLILFLSTTVYLQSCRQKDKKKQKISKEAIKERSIKDWNKTIPGSFNHKQELFFDTLQIASFLEQYPQLTEYKESIAKFYSGRNFAYAWYSKSGLIEQAGNLADRVKNLPEEGITKPIPYITQLDSMLYLKSAKKPDLNLELMLTAQYFVFAKLAWQGMDAAISKKTQWFLPRKKFSYEEYLDSLVKTPGKFAGIGVAPVYRQYELLKNFLLKYKALEEKEKWPAIIADQKSYKPGDSSPVISQIKTRLFKLEDFKGDTTNILYDDKLLEAMKQFQERHGLVADGAIGKGTLNELNVPLNTRIRQLLVNMERSRWLPVQVNTDYLAVNIPEFKLHVYHADSLLWSCNVVVGQSVHKTVIFAGDMKYVVFSPYWNVPPSIVKNEVLPDMRRNSNYLRDHQMEVTGREGGLPVIRQKPGSKNSLGQVKFLFPNSYNIYLHDTPSKTLFNESSRAFSHGCIRIEQPAKLAGFLLRNAKGWDGEKIKEAMNSGKEKYITLKEKVPVFIAYFTAFTDRNNLLNFRKDIYERDKPLADMLLKKD